MAAGDSSTSQLISTLIFNLVVAAIFITFFLILRKRQLRVYEPRTVVETLPEDLRPDELPSGPFAWLINLLLRRTPFFVQITGTDGYFYLRYSLLFTFVAFIGAVITWPILFPVNATNSHKRTGIDQIAFGNVQNKWRYLAHIFLGWIFFGFIMWLIYRELVYYTTFRHALQTTPMYDSLLSSRTLLLAELPEKFLSEVELRNAFPSAVNIWFARDYNELVDKVKERRKLALKYESALNSVLIKAVKIRNKCLKKGVEPPQPVDDLDKYLKDGKKRPTHRLKFLVGEKVDTLNYCVERLGTLNSEIKKLQLQHNANTQLPSAFLEFPTQLELQKAYQAIPYHPEIKNARRYSGLTPDDVVWENLALKPAKRRLKKTSANTFLTFFSIFFCIPMAVIGCIAHVDTLTRVVPQFKFVLNMPDVLMGIINGVLPTVLCGILVSLVPPIIMKFARISGCLTMQEVYAYTQSWFFGFQIINTFLAITIGTSATNVVSSLIDNPDNALLLLAEYVPPASNFYISYFCLMGLSTSSGMLLQLVPLILAQFLGRILDKTPRAKWTRWNTIGSPVFPILYSGTQVLVLIYLAYSLLAPLILGFACFSFILIFCADLYMYVYVLKPGGCDSRGRNYPKSLLQMFCALYFAECLILLIFIFLKNWVCVALQGVLVAATVVCHLLYKRWFESLWSPVPISAIKHAAGNPTFQYPMHDQGWKEIRVEGENYWNGGNQVDVKEEENQVLPSVNLGEKDLEEFGFNGKESTPEKGIKNDEKALSTSNQGDSDQGFSITRFFKPKTYSFDHVRSSMPSSYFNYIEYNPSFIKNAYEDPAVTDDEPHIWIPRDEMGLSEIEKNKALENGVDVSDEYAAFSLDGTVVYAGPPPAYEETIKV